MTDMPSNGATLRVTTWNLNNGGLDDDGTGFGTDARLRGILDILKATGPHHVMFFQECKWGRNGSKRLHQVAEHLDMSSAFLVPAPRYGCDLAVLVRQSPTLRVVQERHEVALPPWFHALLRLQVNIGGVTGKLRRVDLVGVHFAPSSPGMRRLEAEMFDLIGKVPVIAAGDFNACALAERDLPVDVNPMSAKVLRKLEAIPAEIIATAGFNDLGEIAGDLTPTVGFGIGPVPHRADRILTNISGVQVLEHAVLSAATNDGRLSDHDGVTALMRIPV